MVISCSVNRYSRISAKLVDLLMDIVIKNSKKRFDKVLLCKHLTPGVDTHEDFRYILFVGLRIDPECRKSINLQVKQRVDVFFNGDFFIFSQNRIPSLYSSLVQVVDIVPSELGDSMLFICIKDIANTINEL